MTDNGAALLDEVEAFHRRFNAFPTEAAYVAVALWNAHAHLLDCFDSTPRLAFLSPEPGSGKTRAWRSAERWSPTPWPPSTPPRPPCSAPCPDWTPDARRSCSTRSTPSSAPRRGTTRNCAA